MKPADCHSHLYFDQFDEDREKVIQRAADKLEFVSCAGCDPETNVETLHLARNYENVIPSLGLHPTFTDSFDRVEEVKKQIEINECPVIGEIGLDHYHVNDKDVQERQEEVFREMLEVAEERSLPVVVHSREAENRAFEVLKEYNLSEVMLHCFNGSEELAKEAVEEGFLIGVTTQVVYSSQIEKLVKALELNSIVLETDSPFLHHGGRNEPANVLESVEVIAEVKETEEQNVVEKTTENATRLFQQRD